jgi:hypothetical protein
MDYHRLTSNLDMNGTIMKIPIKKFWALFYLGGIVLIITLLTTDWTDLVSILVHIMTIPPVFFLLFFTARSLYQEDAIHLAAKYRFYGKGRKYELRGDLFKKIK